MSKQAGEHPHVGEELIEADIRGTVIRRLVVVGVVIAVIMVTSYLVPTKGIVEGIEKWRSGLGPAFPIVFFACYAIITMFPVPRSAFTFSSGILFTAWVGLVGAMAATMFAAVASFIAIRVIGREKVQPYLKQPVVRAIEARLARRGWLAVGSLRFIAACPFSLANYCSALSAVRFWPYTLATLIGVFPGTAAVVLLGKSLVSGPNPWLIASTVFFFALGIAGLLLDAKAPVEPIAEPAVDES
ncbi:TVP38/TMEM64 family protein [Gordonia sp. X0973]|uniref:TVP38/TMEM64 family protein n=1 Tax=Gordonia sp. X0973 TaxID=2742602 RepID=UPI000F5490D2|nr:TVP38/TMEM64 family protein [Gordonia sp. X0973]QKT07217.1 TVP38/TMEM64 family protein [Gordonia sp. X0973]